MLQADVHVASADMANIMSPGTTKAKQPMTSVSWRTFGEDVHHKDEKLVAAWVSKMSAPTVYKTILRRLGR